MEAKRQDIGMDIDENKKEETQKSTSAVREILSWVLTFALAIGAAFLIKNYLSSTQMCRQAPWKIRSCRGTA